MGVEFTITMNTITSWFVLGVIIILVLRMHRLELIVKNLVISLRMSGQYINVSKMDKKNDLYKIIKALGGIKE